MKTLLAIILVFSISACDAVVRPHEVTIIDVYEEPGTWGDDWKTLIDCGGHRTIRSGRLGVPGDTITIRMSGGGCG